jgi:hypothetical protein
MTDYTNQAEDFLKASNLTFRTVLVGSDCPPFCADAEADRDMDMVDKFPRKTHIHGKHYRCTISGEGRGHVGFDFWNSYADEEFNAYWYGTDQQRLLWRDYPQWDNVRKAGRGPKRIPTGYDLLSAITKYDPGSLENFCSDFGYDTDSRKAEETYRAVLKEWAKVRKFFTEAELEQLQEIA